MDEKMHQFDALVIKNLKINQKIYKKIYKKIDFRIIAVLSA